MLRRSRHRQSRLSDLRRRHEKGHRRLRAEELEPRRMLALLPDLLADANPGVAGSFPDDFTEVGATTYFVANSTQIWKTKGTPATTSLVEDTGALGGAYISQLHDHNGTLVFARYETSAGSISRVQLWKSDGTSVGTSIVKDFGLGSDASSDGVYFTTIGGTLFMSVGNVSNGIELWKSDLTSVGTVQVKDIFVGSGDSRPYDLTNFGGTLVFSARNASSGRELWKSDGTSAGTVRIRDLVVGNYGSYPGDLTIFGGELFFTALNPGVDTLPGTGDDRGQLWKTDGTSAGTTLVKDFGAGSADQFGHELQVAGGILYGAVKTSAAGRELWKSDGTGPGTVLVKDIRPGTDGSYPRHLTAHNGMLFFQANDGTADGNELWKTDGTTAGTVVVRDIDPLTDAYPSELTSFQGKLYFAANHSSYGVELWRTDGTSAGTELVTDLHPSGSSNPYALKVSNGRLYFRADDGSVGAEPYVLGASGSLIGFHRDNRFYQDVNGNGMWDNFAGGDRYFTFGAPGDTPVVGDWDGDGDDDIGFYRGNQFYLDQNGNGRWNGVAGGDVIYTFGAPGDTPIIGDWDGDGDDDIGFHRDNRFYLDLNDNGRWDNFAGGDAWFAFGFAGATPVIGDWNGDNRDDLGFHSGNRFYLDLNGNRVWNNFAGGDGWFAFGAPGDTPLSGDWDADGDDDIGFHRDNRFYLDQNANRAWNGVAGGDVIYTFGAPADTPIIGAWPSTALFAAATGSQAGSSSPPAATQLAIAVEAALQRLRLAGASDAELQSLAQVEVVFTPLDGPLLGQAVGGLILLDTDAAGHGWSLPTLPGSEAYRLGAGQPGGVDLIAVLAHEFGHELGWDHEHDGIMEGVLASTDSQKVHASAVDQILMADLLENSN